MRVPVIAGNWKMYKTAAEAAAFVRAFLPLVSGARGVEIVLAPPYPSIGAVAQLVKGSGIGVASQNVHFADEGAFTGEVSARMLKEAEAGSWLKSIETSGSSTYWRIPFIGPSDAVLIAALISSAVAFVDSSAVRSTTETFGVGTRIAIPSSFPFSSGMTSETALAAPVVVGIIDTPAARARRRSLCGRSRIFWSFV